VPDDASFLPTAISRGRRRPERVAYDEAAVFAVLDTAILAHVGYVVEGRPIVTPTLFWRVGRTLYWHGSAASRMLRAVDGASVCLTVSWLDGLVLDRSGFHHSANYRAVMAFGRARLVKDNVAKQAALDGMIARIYPGRVPRLREPTLAELKQTAFVEMEIDEASVKVRVGGPAAAEPEDAGWNGWRGVLPVETRLGAPLPDPDNGGHRGPSPDLAHFAPGARLDEALRAAAHAQGRAGCSV
jgi:nitroimidazol reductase NimA-like FMN-containing flavoprotein (pyridoxamine 5'-phosphate oxidase superfamily)